MYIWGEARRSSDLAQRAIGYVVRNRVEDGRRAFGSGWRGVLLEPHQFLIIDADANAREQMFHPLEHGTELSWRSSFAGALIAYEALYTDPSGGALFFSRSDSTAVWARMMRTTARIDEFVFSTDQR